MLPKLKARTHFASKSPSLFDNSFPSLDGCQQKLASGFSSTPLELTSQILSGNFKHICPTADEGSA